MNIDYKQWNAFEEGTDQFQSVIEQNPRVPELYERAKRLVENSEFKGKLLLSVRVYQNFVWFTVWPFYQSLEVQKQYFEQDRIPLENLCRAMESHQVNVKDQTIVIYNTRLAEKSEASFISPQ